MVRALVVAVALGAGVARADIAAPRTGAGWVRACETHLRRAADEWDRGLDFPSVDLFRRWDWNVGDETIELHYHHSRMDADYRIHVSRDGWSLTRKATSSRRDADAFLKTFRPALAACLER
jgi:hypothetical protein